MTPPLEVIGTDPDLMNALCRFFSILLSSFFEFLTIQYCSDEASSTSDIPQSILLTTVYSCFNCGFVSYVWTLVDFKLTSQSSESRIKLKFGLR
jgi:hypothetical protein